MERVTAFVLDGHNYVKSCLLISHCSELIAVNERQYDVYWINEHDENDHLIGGERGRRRWR